MLIWNLFLTKYFHTKIKQTKKANYNIIHSTRLSPFTQTDTSNYGQWYPFSPCATHFMHHANSLLPSWLSTQLSSHPVSFASSPAISVSHPESALLSQGLKRTEYFTNGMLKLTGLHVLCNALQCLCHRYGRYTVSGLALSSRTFQVYLNFYHHSKLAKRKLMMMGALSFHTSQLNKVYNQSVKITFTTTPLLAWWGSEHLEPPGYKS